MATRSLCPSSTRTSTTSSWSPRLQRTMSASTPTSHAGLLYTKIVWTTPGYKLIGIMYMARYGATEEELNARVPLSIAEWHVHLTCVFRRSPNNATGL